MNMQDHVVVLLLDIRQRTHELAAYAGVRRRNLADDYPVLLTENGTHFAGYVRIFTALRIVTPRVLNQPLQPTERLTVLPGGPNGDRMIQVMLVVDLRSAMTACDHRSPGLHTEVEVTESEGVNTLLA